MATSSRVSTPSGASRFASHDAFVFGTSPETSSFPIVKIVAFATAREYKEAVPALREQQGAEIRELRADDVDAIAAALLEPGEEGAVSSGQHRHAAHRS